MNVLHQPASVTDVSHDVSTAVTSTSILVLIIALSIAVWIYTRRVRRFRETYTSLAERLAGYVERLDDDTDGVASPGHSYALASRGPTVSRDAEMQSAEARWRHLAVAFPHVVREDIKRELFLISAPYTKIDEVARMQALVADRVKALCRIEGGRVVSEPDWVAELGENFDALRHPQLAIANPAIYTFPFFLTWQRRHQWGVLPYATHTRLGVIIRRDHPKLEVLRKIERDYNGVLQEAVETGHLLWTNDPRYANWLSHLMNAAGSTPSRMQRGPDALPLAQQHVTSTVFSVGAYLHKELLPLTCATMAEPGTAFAYASFAQEIEVTDLRGGDLLSATQHENWREASAVIADLAVVPVDFVESSKLEDGAWVVLRLPHCVYVPIGIGFSVAAVRLMGKGWRNGLLADAGEILNPAKGQLADIGIELDERLWTAGRRNGR